MHNILLDPVLLVSLDETANQAEAEQWLSALQMWAEATSISSHQYYHLRDQIIQHLGYDRFLSFAHMRKVQRRYQLDVALPAITTMINEVLMQDTSSFLPALEDHLLAQDLLVEPAQETIQLQPDHISTRWPGELAACVLTILAVAAVGKNKTEPFCNAVALATTNQTPSAPHEDQLTLVGEASILSAQVHDEHASFSATIPLFSDPEILLFTDIRSAWEQGEQAIPTRLAIRCRPTASFHIWAALPCLDT
jgi:hypothetical protein